MGRILQGSPHARAGGPGRLLGRSSVVVPVGTSVVTLLPPNDARCGLLLSPPAGTAGAFYSFLFGQDPASASGGIIMTFGTLPLFLSGYDWG